MDDGRQADVLVGERVEELEVPLSSKACSRLNSMFTSRSVERVMVMSCVGLYTFWMACWLLMLALRENFSSVLVALPSVLSG